MRENLTSGCDGEGLETGPRSTPNGHVGGNSGYSQGQSYGLPRQPFTRQIAFDEIKAHQCATLRGQPPTVLRSKTPALVEQDLYAMVIVYNLVRDLIHQGAVQHNHDPRDMSFLESLHCLIEAIPFVLFVDRALAADTFEYLLELIGQCTIDRPRRPRKNPRVVKVKMAKFKRKQCFHRSEQININDDLRIIDPKAA